MDCLCSRNRRGDRGLKMNPENDNSKDQGEILAFMKDMKKESESMMKDLMEIDDILLSLRDKVQKGKISKKKTIEIINSIRLRIGVIEREDKRELNEEEIAQSLLQKLKRWVDEVV